MAIADLEHKIDEQTERIVSLEVENKILREENQLLKSGLFGRKTERIDAGQLGMFLTNEAVDDPLEANTSAPKKERKKAKGHGRAAFGEHIPRETIELDVEEGDRDCPSCGKEMLLIGEDVTERGHMVPAKLTVRRYVKKKYACPDGHAVRTADAPAALIDRCKSSRRSTRT